MAKFDPTKSTNQELFFPSSQGNLRTSIIPEWADLFPEKSFLGIIELMLAPSWLVSSVGRALHRYRRGHGFKSRTGLNFFQVLISTTSSVVLKG